MTDQLFCVDLHETRSVRFWVRAEDQESAERDARILTDSWDDDFDNYEQDVDVMPASPRRQPETGEMIWTGGAQGDWDFVGG